jgi:hypothetical protein
MGNTNNHEAFHQTPTAKAIRAVYDAKGQNYYQQLVDSIVQLPEFCRIYSKNGVEQAEGFIPTHFEGSINHGGEPYYCPNGWRRWAVNIGLTAEQFTNKYDDWAVAYHGTHPENSLDVLRNGFRAFEGCFLGTNETGIYLSPSIEYCGHPRYATIYSANGCFVQTVLQVRINPKLISIRGPGTLPGAFANDSQIDPNMPNSMLEWVVRWPEDEYMDASDGLVVYGFMMRITDKHPGQLSKNKWWHASRPEYWDYK